MFKKLDRSIVVALAMLESTVPQAAANEVWFFTGKQISLLLGGRWNTYRQRACYRLAEQGVLEVIQMTLDGRNVTYFGLAHNGYEQTRAVVSRIARLDNLCLDVNEIKKWSVR